MNKCLKNDDNDNINDNNTNNYNEIPCYHLFFKIMENMFSVSTYLREKAVVIC